MRFRVWSVATLSVYSVALLCIAFWPTSVEKAVVPTFGEKVGRVKQAGAPGWFTYGLIEALGNIALFIPFGVLLAVILARTSWWRLLSVSVLTSALIEAGQFLFLPHRTASWADIGLNALGAGLGLLAARLAVRRQSAKQNAPQH